MSKNEHLKYMTFYVFVLKDNRSETSAQSTDHSGTSGCNVSTVEPTEMTKYMHPFKNNYIFI